MNEVYASHVGSAPPGALHRRGREASVGCARRDRGDRSRLGRSRTTSARSDSTHTSSAARYATSCSGTTRRTPTSSFRAWTSTGCARSLAPHGRAEELVVAGRPVGVRFYPRDTAVRKLVRAGIELAPPRREVSTGPGRHDFEIVVDPTATVEDDLERRDFTVNAMARRLADGTLVDPFGGRADLEAKTLRTVSASSFAEDPLRLVRGLRFVSQLCLEPDEQTLAQMREEAASVELVSGERIGGGLAADGMGELSKLLLGAQPAKALRLARDTGVLVHLLPEFEPAIGFEQESRWHALTRRRAHVRGRAGRCRRGVPAARSARSAFPRPRASRTSPGVAPTGGCTTTPSVAARSEVTSRSAHSSLRRRSTGCATRPSCASGSCASSAAT